MKTWVRHSLNVGALTAGALLASGAAAQASPVMTTADNLGLLNGTQALVPVQLPVNVCGNAIGVAGDAHADCAGGATALNPEWGFDNFLSTTANTGALNGTQALVPVQAPINVCGNSVAVIGATDASCDGGAIADPGYRYGESAVASGSGGEALVSSGNVGLLNGTQLLAPIQVPVDVCGNAVSVLLAGAHAGCEGGATAIR